MLKQKKQIQSEQSGMTAIMLAMFLAIVISLLAVGFATLVRKDQAETLDKTLSYQAQYAAESGVNRITSYLDNSVSPATRESCGGALSNPSDTDAPNSSFDVGQAQVTCAVWESGIDDIVLEPTTNDPKFASFKGVDAINISWFSEGHYGNPGSKIPDNLDLDKPILAVSISPKNNFSDVNTKRFYIVPSNSECGDGADSKTYSYSSNKGDVFCAKVTASDNANITISELDDGVEYYINVNPINGSGSKKVTINGTTPGAFKNTSQYKIDVNAKAQDITKRVVVYYNPSGTPGKPYVVNIPSGGTICKDYKVDGTQGTSVSGGGAANCPNPTP